jgi:hypothetical protein
MAKFRCKASGNIIEFTIQHDIDTMEGHDGYEEIFDDAGVEQEEEEKQVEEAQTETPVKRKGRPPKGSK